MLAFQVPRVAETRSPWYGVSYYLLVLGAFSYYMIELFAKHRYVELVEATTYVIPTVMNQNSAPMFPTSYCSNRSRDAFFNTNHCFNNTACVMVPAQDTATIQATEMDFLIAYGGQGPTCESFYVLNSNLFLIYQFGFVHPTTGESVSVDECEMVVTCTNPDMCEENYNEYVLPNKWTRDNNTKFFFVDVKSILSSIGLKMSPLLYNGAVMTAEFYFNTHRPWSMDIGPRCHFRVHLLNNLFAAGVQASVLQVGFPNATGSVTFTQVVGRFFPMQIKVLVKSKAEVGIPSAFAVINHLLQMTVMTGVACTIVTTAVTLTRAFREDVHILKDSPPVEPDHGTVVQTNEIEKSSIVSTEPITMQGSNPNSSQEKENVNVTPATNAVTAASVPSPYPSYRTSPSNKFGVGLSYHEMTPIDMDSISDNGVDTVTMNFTEISFDAFEN